MSSQKGQAGKEEEHGSQPMKCVVVMPAYNAEQTVLYTCSLIPNDCVDEIILVDDGSIDATVKVARSLDLKLIVHPNNAGYGANQKTCYTEALKRGADIVIMLHPDGQYDPLVIPQMIEAIKQGKGDLILASRFLHRKGPLKGGMPLYKYISNRFLTTLENIVLGLRLSEYHTGYRAYSRRLLETIPFLNNSNDFVFDQQFIFQTAHFGFKIHEIPVETKYFDAASSINFKRSVVYGLSTLLLIVQFVFKKIGFTISIYKR
jgi:glycosyltransferase involved in cell wall biosynthesis